MNKQKCFYVTARLFAFVLATVLLRSAVSHAGNSYYFLSTVYSYKMVGIGFGRVVAAILPTIQMTLAICFLLAWWPRSTFLVSGVLFCGFCIAQISALQRGLNISCGCFGAGESLTIGPNTVALAGCGVFLSILGFVLTPRQNTL
jgi:putative oxidoreductase